MRFTAYKRQRSGFTLIELMVVIVLIGIMAAAIIPEMHGTYENALLRSTSRQWLDAINLAYSRAVTVNQAHRVRLDRHLNTYFIEKHVSSGGDHDGFVPVQDDSASGKIDARISVQFRSPGEGSGDEAGQPAAPEAAPEAAPDGSTEGMDETIGFYPDGTADAREIVLRDQDGFRLALRINPVTARVQVVELPRQ